MEGFKIWCNTREEFDAVLQKMEECGILWVTGDKPTNTKLNKDYIALFVSCENELTWHRGYDYFKKHPAKELTLEEYLKEK